MSRVRGERKRAVKERRGAMGGDINPTCAACNYPYPPIAQMHHIIPLSETGIPIPKTIFLCPTCHTMVHEVRKLLYYVKKPANYQNRMLHLEYWFDEADKGVVNKICELAKSGIK